MKQFSVLLVAIFFSGCAAPDIVMRYGGEPRSRNDVAVLQNSTQQGAKIYSLNGEDILNRFKYWDPDAWEELHIEPGVHTLGGGIFLESAYAPFMRTHRFEAGERYTLRYEVSEDASSIKIDIIPVP